MQNLSLAALVAASTVAASKQIRFQVATTDGTTCASSLASATVFDLYPTPDAWGFSFTDDCMDITSGMGDGTPGTSGDVQTTKIYAKMTCDATSSLVTTMQLYKDAACTVDALQADIDSSVPFYSDTGVVDQDPIVIDLSCSGTTGGNHDSNLPMPFAYFQLLSGVCRSTFLPVVFQNWFDDAGCKTATLIQNEPTQENWESTKLYQLPYLVGGCYNASPLGTSPYYMKPSTSSAGVTVKNYLGPYTGTPYSLRIKSLFAAADCTGTGFTYIPGSTGSSSGTCACDSTAGACSSGSCLDDKGADLVSGSGFCGVSHDNTEYFVITADVSTTAVAASSGSSSAVQTPEAWCTSALTSPDSGSTLCTAVDSPSGCAAKTAGTWSATEGCTCDEDADCAVGQSCYAKDLSAGSATSTGICATLSPLSKVCDEGARMDDTATVAFGTCVDTGGSGYYTYSGTVNTAVMSCAALLVTLSALFA